MLNKQSPVVWDAMAHILRHCNGDLIKTIVGINGNAAWVNTDYYIATVDVNMDPEARISSHMIQDIPSSLRIKSHSVVCKKNKTIKFNENLYQHTKCVI